MRIVIDMQGAQTDSRYRGIGRYSLSFVKALARKKGEHEIILALNGAFQQSVDAIKTEFTSLIPAGNIRVWEGMRPVQESEQGNDGRRRVSELMREAFLASLRPDIVHVTSLFEGYVDDAVSSIGRFDDSVPVTVSLYDLIPLSNPDHYLMPNPVYGQYYRRKIEYLKRASAYLAISEASRLEAISALALPDEAVINVSTAIGGQFSPDTLDLSQSKALSNKFGLTKPFVLYTGGADPRKNLLRLIQAYADLADSLRRGHQLVLAGKIGEHEFADLNHCAHQAGLGAEEWKAIGYVSDEELVQLYRSCRLFVFPSWHEGFGLPVLEAMACGAPVICSNTSSLPEVIADESALFDPFDTSSISRKLAQALGDEVFRSRLAEHGIEQSRNFSWDRCAERAIQVFEEIHERAANFIHEKPAAEEITACLTRAIAREYRQARLPQSELASIAAMVALNHPLPGRRRHIYVDVSELVNKDARTGIQRVTRAILKALLEMPLVEYVVEPVYSCQGSGVYKLGRSFRSRFLDGATAQGEDDYLLEPQAGDVFLGLDLQPYVVSECQGYFRYLRRRGVQVFFVVYDLLPVQLPWAFPEGAAHAHENWLNVVAEADGALCISKAVSEQLQEWFAGSGRGGKKQPAVHWFHLGSDIESSAPTSGLPPGGFEILKEIESRRTFLMVGTVEPRKGHEQVLAAFDSLWQEGIDVGLVVVGKRGWDTDHVAQLLQSRSVETGRLIWVQHASDEFLKLAYGAATCLIMASQGEGLGLPLVEAARHKLPIIARDLPVFREVAAEHAWYFSGSKPDALATAVKEWLTNCDAGKVPSSEAIPYWTWENSALEILHHIVPEASCHDLRCRLVALADPDSPPGIAGLDRGNVLQLCPYPLRRPRHGGQLRAAAIKSLLERNGFNVQTIGFYQSEAYGPDDLGEQDIPFPVDSPFRLYQGNAVAGISDFSMAAFSASDDVVRKVADATTKKISAIVLDQPWMYPLAERLKQSEPPYKDAVIIYSSHNIEAPMKLQIIEATHDAKTVAAIVADIDSLERRAACQSDLCIAVTDADAAVLQSCGSQNVVVAKNGINPWVADREHIELWKGRLPTLPWAVFIASAHPPNYTGFIDCVGDALGCIPPGSRLVVVGGVGELLEKELTKSKWQNLNRSRLLVLGMLSEEDLAAVKDLAHVFLLPIGAGGGSNIKTAEALYSGKAVVCTSMALRGFETYREFPTVHVADDPKTFQAAIRASLTTARPVLSDAQKEACRQLSWDASLASIPQHLQQALEKQGVDNEHMA